MLFILIGVYAIQKMDILLNGRDVDLKKMTTTNALTSEDQFDYTNGFNFAVGLVTYDGNRESEEDPTIGELVFNHYKWGLDKDGNYFSGRYRINSHRCTPEELGLGQTARNFSMFPIETNFSRDIDLYQKKFICPDKEDLLIFGDYNTQDTQIFNVQFIKCHDRPDCKTPDEITKTLRNKYIL